MTFSVKDEAAARVELRHLLVYTHALSGGGAERVCAVLATGFARSGWQVTVAVDALHSDNAGYLDPSIKVEVLGKSHVGSVLRLARLLARNRPDVTLSAIGSCNVKHAVAAGLCGRLKRAVLSYHAFSVSEPQRLSQAGYWFAAILSRVTARTVVVSNGLRTHLVERWRASSRRTTVLYNPVVLGPDRSPLPSRTVSPPMLLASGRLVPDKNMIGLLRAYGRIAGRSDASLVILGEGPDRAALEAEIRALGLIGRVSLAGYVAEPWDFYRAAAALVSASMIESFSMVIAEALSYGLSVVAYDSAGPREILADGAFGTLVPVGNEAGLGEAMLQALNEPQDPAKLRARGAIFSPEAGVAAYRALFEAIICEAAPRRRHARTRSMPTPTRDVGVI